MKIVVLQRLLAGKPARSRFGTKRRFGMDAMMSDFGGYPDLP